MSDLYSHTKPTWCPGCGNYLILKTIDQAIAKAGLDRRKVVLVSGIGQAAKLPHYVGEHGVEALDAAASLRVCDGSARRHRFGH